VRVLPVGTDGSVGRVPGDGDQRQKVLGGLRHATEITVQLLSSSPQDEFDPQKQLLF
jgi:hypothetical protein